MVLAHRRTPFRSTIRYAEPVPAESVKSSEMIPKPTQWAFRRSAARRRAILHHFGSAEAFVQASREELEGVPGLPAKTARAVYAQLHKAGRG